MTVRRMIELLEIEHECMMRGAHDECDRDCANCELVQDDGDLHEMYSNVIEIVKTASKESDWISELYLEIKQRWNQQRIYKNSSKDELLFLIHLMEEIERHIDETEEDA